MVTSSPVPGMDPGVRYHGMKANPTAYWVPMVQVGMLSDKWLPRYRLLEKFNTKILVFGDVLDFDL